ncbi:hypothetical protein LTS17_010286 [Exophiala oligosperma]
MSHIRCVNYPGYETIAEKYGLSAAVCISAGARLVVTSGHVGMDEERNMKVDLREQMVLAFKTRSGAHVGGVDEGVTDLLASVAKEYMGIHRPAWAAVGVETLAAGTFEMCVSAALPGAREAANRSISNI